MRSEKEKMLAGELYRATGPELAADYVRADRLLRAYNMTGADETVRRLEILRQLLGAIAEDAIVRPPFCCDYGYNTHVAAGVFVTSAACSWTSFASTSAKVARSGPVFRF